MSCIEGEAWGDWSLYTDSPLRALTPAQEAIAGTGGPFPENFWDPAGITAKKSRLEGLTHIQIVYEIYFWSTYDTDIYIDTHAYHIYVCDNYRYMNIYIWICTTC